VRLIMDSSFGNESVADLGPLSRGFYQRPTEDVARELLGKILVRGTPEGWTAIRLTEVEAYLGVSDAACHTFGGRRTVRTEVMWGEAGFAYVYMIYGIHHCLNVVTVGEGHAEAVLVRGGLPVVGELVMRARRGGAENLCGGPGRLCQALAVTRDLNGVDLCDRCSGLFLADDGWCAAAGRVERLPRVGVGYAKEAAGWPLRFRVKTAHPGRRAETG